MANIQIMIESPGNEDEMESVGTITGLSAPLGQDHPVAHFITAIIVEVIVRGECRINTNNQGEFRRFVVKKAGNDE